MPAGSCDVLVIGGGPAGLRAAELVSQAGLHTILTDRMPSVGRKFLVAGKGGLNLTHSEPINAFATRYGDDRWKRLLAGFSPSGLRGWAKDLGIETFIGTSGRVFPMTKQAAPLLRRWVTRLKEQKVEFRLRHDWTALTKNEDAWEASFRTIRDEQSIEARAILLALGGGSWPQTGSDAAWISILSQAGVALTPLAPSNCGYEVSWPVSFLAEAEGKPLKNIVVSAGERQVAGELLVTRYGLEGGALYQLGRALRDMRSPALSIDLKPGLTAQQLVEKLGSSAPDLLAAAVRAWKLSPAAAALLRLCPVPSANALAALAKSFPLALCGPRPLEEAISSAGGVAWDELDDALMLCRLPGVFCAGEMIEWDAPTGGYLLQGCFSTATRAARGLTDWLGARKTLPDGQK